MKKFIVLLFLFFVVGVILFYVRDGFRPANYPPSNYLKVSTVQTEHLPFHQEIKIDEKNNYFMVPFVGANGNEWVLRIIGWPYGKNPLAFYIDILNKSDPNIVQLPSKEKLHFNPPIVNGFVDTEDFEHFQKDLATINDNPVEEIKGKDFVVQVKKISSEYYLPTGLEATITYKNVAFEVIGEHR